MGSGGPRGLQIPRSGASRVRGRFDSYAFPPLLLAAACLLAGGFVPVPRASAQTSPADRLAPPAVEAVTEPDTARVRAPRRGWSDQPRTVMLRSLLVPGWGQAHNRAWIKAVLVAGTEAALGVGIANDWRESERLLDRANALAGSPDEAAYANAVSEYNARLDQLVRRQWLLGAVIAYALVDAYVDAHFRDIDIEFRHDPALPDGPPSELSARISYRWTF